MKFGRIEQRSNVTSQSLRIYSSLVNFTTRAKKSPVLILHYFWEQKPRRSVGKTFDLLFSLYVWTKIPNVNFAESYFFGLAKRSFLQARTWPLNLIYENLFLVRSVKDLYILSKEKINHHFLEVVWASVKIIISNKHFLKRKNLRFLKKNDDFSKWEISSKFSSVCTRLEIFPLFSVFTLHWLHLM